MTLVQTEPKAIKIGSTDIKKVMLGSTQIRPAGWTPGANTIAYYPLTSITKEVDQKGVWTYSSGTKATFGIYTSANVDCASFNSTTGMVYTGSVPLSGVFTFSSWLYSTRTSGDDGKIIDIVNSTANPYTLRIPTYYYSGRYHIQPEVNGTAYDINGIVSNNSWHLITYVSNGTTTYIYDNASMLSSRNISYISATMVSLTIGNQKWNEISRHFKGYMSEIIIENKARTEQEITDYYNQTKGNYGL